MAIEGSRFRTGVKFYRENSSYIEGSNSTRLKDTSFYATVDTKTHLLYMRDSESVVRVKCLGSLILTPLATVARLISSIVRTIFLALKGMGQACTLNSNCKKSFKKSALAFTDIFRSVLYGLAMEGSALYGAIVDPFTARVWYANLERSYFRDGDTKNFLAHSYLMKCFQPTGNTVKAHNNHIFKQIHLYKESCNQLAKKYKVFLESDSFFRKNITANIWLIYALFWTKKIVHLNKDAIDRTYNISIRELKETPPATTEQRMASLIEHYTHDYDNGIVKDA